MTKKEVIRNFGGWKSRNFTGKGKILEIFHRVWKFVAKNQGANNKYLPVSGELVCIQNNSAYSLITWNLHFRL